MNANLLGFGAVVFKVFLEPWMLQGLFGGDALLRVVDEDAVEQVEKLTIERCVVGDDVLLRQCQ